MVVSGGERFGGRSFDGTSRAKEGYHRLLCHLLHRLAPDVLPS